VQYLSLCGVIPIVFTDQKIGVHMEYVLKLSATTSPQSRDTDKLRLTPASEPSTGS